MTGPDSLSRLQAALAGRYTVERVLGRGGWATVYLAHDAKHARPVALKVLRPELGAALGPARFLREIAIAGRLTHPHVLPLYDSGEADGSLYYVMPFVEGETLRQRIERERQLPLADALAIARQVGEALTFAHAHNVIHRDIKPENILLEQADQAYLADFGIARAILAATGDTISEPGLAVGTPAYMSPEQASGRERLDARSDLYSLACVVYEMLTGEPPHTGPTAQAILARQQGEAPRSIRLLRPSVPEEVEHAVLTALAKAPADRFGSVAEFISAISGQTGTPRPGTGQPPRAGRRHLLAIAAVLGLGGLVWLAVRRASPTDPGAQAVSTRLAVLYFDDLSGGQTLRPVADGLTEDLIDELGRVPALRVISPNGVRPFLGRAAPPDSIGRALGVGTLVGGSVERSADVLRVTVRLIDAETGLQLHSRTLEYPFHQLFTLQDRLAGEVSRILRQRLGREIVLRQRREDTRSVPAWELAQEGEGWREAARTLRDRGDPTAARRALDAADSLYARASALDSAWPQPVIARGWLAETRMQLAEGSRPDSVAVWFQAGLRHAEAALGQRPRDPTALELRGSLRYRHWLASGGDSAEVASAEEDLRAGAAASNPSQARAWATLSALLQATGRFAEANLMARRAYDADAFLIESPTILFRLYHTSFDLGDEEEAFTWCDTGLQRFPDDWRFSFCQLTTLVWRGRQQSPDSARAGVARAWELVSRLERLVSPEEVAVQRPRWQIRVAPLLGRAGLRDSAEAVIRRARAIAGKDPEMDFYEAEARMLLGDREAALRLLARDLEGNPRFREYVRVYPVFRPLWSDPRFQAMVGGPGSSP